MTTEQVNGIAAWWDEQSFPGKNLFRLDESGNLLLTETPLNNERTIATLTLENCDATLKQLVEKFEHVQQRVKDTEAEWVAAPDKLKLIDKVDNLKEFLLHSNSVGDFGPLLRLVNDWDNTVKSLVAINIEAKTKIAEMAEALAESTDFKEATQGFKDITDKWKQTGYVDKSRNDKIWNRIEAARKTFQERKKTQQDEEEKDLFHTLDLKIELAEQAEAMANSEEWKKSAEAFQKIVDTWKTIGRTLPRKNEELWQRIMTAKNTFFDRKKAYFAQLQTEQEANYVTKLAMVEKAEAMQHSTEWNVTAQAFAALMEEWKKTGRVPQERGDDLWKRFTAAQEVFFSARKKFLDETREFFDNNYKLKAALLKRAEEIKNSNRWGEATTEMNRLFDEWKKIGPVPKEHNAAMWDAFIGARKHFYKRKDEYKDQRRVLADAHRSARLEQAHMLVFKMKEEIAQEEEKLADFENAISNITPGKKAKELQIHLEVLISDSKAKMKRLHEKLAAGIDELKDIEERDKEERAREKEREAEMAPRNKVKEPQGKGKNRNRNNREGSAADSPEGQSEGGDVQGSVAQHSDEAAHHENEPTDAPSVLETVLSESHATSEISETAEAHAYATHETEMNHSAEPTMEVIDTRIDNHDDVAVHVADAVETTSDTIAGVGDELNNADIAVVAPLVEVADEATAEPVHAVVSEAIETASVDIAEEHPVTDGDAHVPHQDEVAVPEATVGTTHYEAAHAEVEVANDTLVAEPNELQVQNDSATEATEVIAETVAEPIAEITATSEMAIADEGTPENNGHSGHAGEGAETLN